jgi:hypothetical protein
MFIRTVLNDESLILHRIALQVNTTMATPVDFLNFIETNKDRFIQRLARAVEIPR